MLREVRIGYLGTSVLPRFCIDVRRVFTDAETGATFEVPATGNYSVRQPDLDADPNVRLTDAEKAIVLAHLAHTAKLTVWEPPAEPKAKDDVGQA